MPRNFSPADRETVREAAEDQQWSYSVAGCGPGVVVQVVRQERDNHNKTFERLMREYGWYVDGIYPDDHGDLIVLMPVTEVPS